ncbi:uncharacterized protein LOC124620160 [Schistocerca americana]|uniref:uncharacterized protein LOC124620160 n=1 Tax=Schistocerca americana TaxID=7009 RepID=UPI001F4FEF0A|nr:uncharacterized protein LOC124620160 [Schistocerca americana]
MEGAWGLKLLEARIPSYVVRNQSVTHQCLFDLEGEALYSVKWYKDGREFYRYVPRDAPPAQLFPLAGVTVDMESSNASQVVYKTVGLGSSGRYRCEVSGEAPSFQTVTDHGDMVVVALPEDGPVITGARARYHVGDTVHLNCTSGRSRPPAELTWFVNGEQANSSVLVGPEVVGPADAEGLVSARLGLHFRSQAAHFRHGGSMKLKCLATVATVYWRSNEESVRGDKPQRARVMESRGAAAAARGVADDGAGADTLRDMLQVAPTPALSAADGFAEQQPRQTATGGYGRNPPPATSDVNGKVFDSKRGLTMKTIIPEASKYAQE